jgi:hypothetical protein
MRQGTPSLDPCLQACFSETCPAFSGTVTSVVACMQQNCAAPCGLASGDGGTLMSTQVDGGSVDLCTPCLEAQCASMTATCVSQTACVAAGNTPILLQ